MTRKFIWSEPGWPAFNFDASRFERAISKQSYGGLGLGLWITRQIVDALGGRIRVESAFGKGSTFEVELPLEKTAEATA